ncbi:MAG TPA: hypothetical protein DEH25_11945 [Chloroflexi bacterium]|nr:hypothetical protein [Chloroflexota bacterium]
MRIILACARGGVNHARVTEAHRGERKRCKEFELLLFSAVILISVDCDFHVTLSAAKSLPSCGQRFFIPSRVQNDRSVKY